MGTLVVHAENGLSTHVQSRFETLAALPEELKWLARISNDQTRRAYQSDIRAFMNYNGIRTSNELRCVERIHVDAWVKSMFDQKCEAPTIRRKLAALNSLCSFLCEYNLMLKNPVTGVKRPKVSSYEGKTPALSDAQAKQLLEAPDTKTLKGLRDAAILSVLLYHGLRRAEVSTLKVKDVKHSIRGVMHIIVHGKGDKIRYLPLQKKTHKQIKKYLAAAGHADDGNGPLFRKTVNLSTKAIKAPLSTQSIYVIVTGWLEKIGIEGDNLGPHAMRATSATNALENGNDMGSVQDFLGHASISTTKLYDRRVDKNVNKPVLVNFSGKKRSKLHT